MITVLLVDHPAAVLRAVRESLLGQEQIAIVGEASGKDGAARLAESVRPHVIVLDAEMANVDMAALVGQVHARSPTSAFVILTLEPTRLAGVFGRELRAQIVSKIDGVSALVTAIRQAGHQ